MIVVLMGVSGCGKTTVGTALAEALEWPLLDADEFHPPENVAKMAAGIPLDDADRMPWLDRIASELARMNRERRNAVLACSALKQAYRDRLAVAGDVRFVHLRGDYDTIHRRIATRPHKYMPPSLLASQFATLEPPRDALAIDVDMSVDAQVKAIREGLGLAARAGAGTR
jgi:gluconokinase